MYLYGFNVFEPEKFILLVKYNVSNSKPSSFLFIHLQLKSRKQYGLLEKHKDYVLRAR